MASAWAWATVAAPDAVLGKGWWSARSKMTVGLELLRGAELVRVLEGFRVLYNQRRLIERLGFEPPVQARQRLVLQAAV